MQKIIILALLLMATACTKTPDQGSNYQSQTLEAQGDGTFGPITYGTTVVKSLVFKNTSNQTVSGTPQLIGSGFEIALALGCESIEPGKSCLVKVMFNSSNKESGDYTSTLKVENKTVSLTASLAAVPATVYNFSVNGQLIDNELSLGELEGSNFKLITLKIKNNSPKVGGVSTLSLSNTRFKVIYNSCQQVSLKPGSSCTARVYVRGDNTNDLLNSEISFDNQSASVSATQSQQILNPNLMSVNSSISLGDFYEEGKNKIQSIVVKNLGAGPGTIDSIDLPPEYTLLFNNCLSVKPGQSCIIRLVYTSVDQDKGSHSDTVQIGSGNVDLVSNQVSNPNSLSTLSVVVAENVLVNTCTPVSVAVKDSEGLDYVSSQVLTIQSSETLYSDTNCSSPATTLAPFESTKTFYTKKSVAGLVNLNIAINALSVIKGVYWFETFNVSSDKHVSVVNSPVQVTVSGGKSPYTYSVTGNGSITNGVFSSTQAGNSSVKVVDALNHEATIAINVVNVLQLTAQSNQVVNSNQTFIPAGGLAPYVFQIVSGGGSINAASGLFTASGNAGTVTVRVSDASEQSSDVSVNVVSVLNINPTSSIIITGNHKVFSAVGGLNPYSFSVSSGMGSVGNVSGDFTAPAAAGSASVTVTDALGQTATASITVVIPLTLSAQKNNQVVNTTQNLSAVGGLNPYSYSIVNGLGSINSLSGSFTSGNAAGTVNFKVTDASGQTANASVNVVPVLTISPAIASVIVGSSSSFLGVGGLAPYSYTVLSGTGSINSANGLFIAPNTAGTATIRVTDSLNQIADSVVTIAANIAVTPGTCSYSVPESVNCTVSSTGGIGTKTFTTNVGTINPTTGVFKGLCVNNSGSSIVTVTDQYSNSAQVTLSYPCVYTSCNQIRAEGFGVADGNYWLDVDGLNNGQDPFSAYCGLNDADGSGWTMIASGGSSCIVNSVNSMTAKTSGLSLSNCGYTPIGLVQPIAQNINSVRLRSGLNHSNFEQVVSTGANTINALKNNTSWHNGASSEWTGSAWIWGSQTGCASPAATAWPNMYHSCDNGNGVHWLVGGIGANHYRRYNTPTSDVATSTWVKTNYYKLGRTCQDAKTRGLKNQAGTTTSGTYTIDPDGFGYGAAAFDVYCEQEMDGGGWMLSYTQHNGGYLNLMTRNAAVVTPNSTGSHQKLETLFAYSTQSRWTDMGLNTFMQFSAYASQGAVSPSSLSVWSSAMLTKQCGVGDPTIWMRFSNGYMNTASQARKMESCYVNSAGGATFLGFRNNTTYAPFKDYVNNSTTHECWHDENAFDRVFAVHGDSIGQGHCNQFGYNWAGRGAGRGGSMNYMIWVR